MERLDIKRDFIEQTPHYKGLESNIFILGDQAIKIFKTSETNNKEMILNKNNNDMLLNKLNKIILLNKVEDDILKPNALVYIDGVFRGYTMDNKVGFSNISGFNGSIKEKQVILAKTYLELEKLHRNGIIYGDLHEGNVMVNNKGDICLCDLDNVKIGNLDFDIVSVNQRRYLYFIKDVDYSIDTYMFNLLAVAFLNNIDTLFSLDYLKDKRNIRKIKKFIAAETIDSMINLDENSKAKIKTLINVA